MFGYQQQDPNHVHDKLKLIGEKPPNVWTIGHSTRTIADFSELLTINQITNLVDVRSYPGSRRYPQFNKAELARELPAMGFAYCHLVKLGGRRKPLPDSRNTAWRNPSFRAYADHMESNEFAEGIAELIELAALARTAIMCAEAVWWQCHRGLIADYLKAQGSDVVHIISRTRTELHPYTEAAHIIDGRLSYAGLLDL